MATAADSSSNHHSPRGPAFSGDGVSSPQFRRKNFSSPWAQIVSSELELFPLVNLSSSSSPLSTEIPPQQNCSSDCSPLEAAVMENGGDGVSVSTCTVEESPESNSGNASRLKKPAWNKPTDGIVKASPVMGAVSWPALSESARPSSKSSSDSSSSSKFSSDGLLSTSQGPLIPRSPKKQAASDANTSSASNHLLPARQRSMKRGGCGHPHSNSPHPRPPPPPPPPPPPLFPVFDMPPNAFGNLMPAALPDSTPIEPIYRGNDWEIRPAGGFIPQPHMANEHPSPRNSSRRARGDGQYYNKPGGRRNHDNGNYNMNSRSSVPPQRAPSRGYVRHPPPRPSPFVAPQPMRPFGNPTPFSELGPHAYFVPTMSPDSFRGVSFVTHAPPAVFFPVPDPNLPNLLVNQIDYYFSDANLVKDEYLRSNMDEQGWVPISLIANFPRVKSLTNNIQLILDFLRASSVVEVQDDKVRRRNEWMKWIPSAWGSADSDLLPPPRATYNAPAASFGKLTLEEEGTDLNSSTGKAGPFEESAAQSQPSKGEEIEGSRSSQN